jgi:hypothetical protein
MIASIGADPPVLSAPKNGNPNICKLTQAGAAHLLVY